MSKGLRLSIVWLFLMGLTCFAFYLGEQNQTQTFNVLLLILGLGVTKAQLLVDNLMGLKLVGGFWRTSLSLYTIIIFTLVAFLI